ncbi:transporter [Acidiphilium sp. AL]|uniref:Transporter n=1 Tax=Acidiphilium iwatense TaxID=768198 RepID=A0ABS9DUX8_9PROT|nr:MULTISPECIES: transporter [Acidiphilium]MCF3946530.1 transporter [Acidiphilium iwatense]MCU4160431.1 transporter [Acidiphilium sp. AL]
MRPKVRLNIGRIAYWCGVGVLGAVVATSIASTSAEAAAPLPYDLPTPPPNVNVGIIYNQFSTAGSFYTANGTKVGNTHIATDVPILRYVHTFSPIDGMQWGVQVIAPDVNFLGNTKIGGASLSTNGGFAEPLLSAFIYPLDDPAEDQYLTLAYFLSPPVGAYNANSSINAGTHNWVNNPEIGYGHIVFGKPKGKRLDFQIWLDAYFYGVNNDGPAVGPFGSHVHTQPTGQVIVYLPYFFHPQTDAYVGLSFEQTFGGKQYLTSPIGSFDTGNRNNVTTIGINAGSFLAPTVFAQASLGTDVRVRGGARRNVIFQIQVGKIF